MKRVLMCLAAVVLLASGLAGCAGGDPTAQELIEKVQAAAGDVRSFRTEMGTEMKIEVVGGEDASTADVKLVGTGAVDVTGKKASAEMQLDMTLPGQATQTLPMEVYATDEWKYIMVSMGGEEQWGKMKQDADWLAATSQVAQQLKLIEGSAVPTTFTRETVDGVSCYVIEIKPDVMTLLNLMLTQSQTQSTMGLQGRDFEGFDFAKVVKTIKVKQWIARSTYLLKKTEAEIAMSMLPEDFASSGGASGFERMDFSMNLTVTFSDYNKALNIQLPAGAATAEEIPGN